MTDKPRLLPEFEIIASDEGFIIHDAGRDVVHYLNQTAAIVLALCNGERSAPDIAKLLAHQFELGESPTSDVTEILEKFQTEGLLA